MEALDLAELPEKESEVPSVAWPVQVVLVGVLGDQVELLGAGSDQNFCLVDHVVKVLASKFTPVFVVPCTRSVRFVSAKRETERGERVERGESGVLSSNSYGRQRLSVRNSTTTRLSHGKRLFAALQCVSISGDGDRAV